MTDPRSLLQAHGLHARKWLGQHFLVDPAMPELIAVVGGAGKDDAVFEIGAGTGVLTRALAPRVGRLIALEHDRDLVPVLHTQLLGFPHVSVREGDIREVDWAGVASELGQDPIIYGNIPYNLSSAIIIGLLESTHWRRACFLLQKEFAERITAPPGTRLCGTLSAGTALLTYATLEFLVPASAFLPPPKVESAVVVLERRPAPAEDVGDVATFRQVVRALFAQRRKMARGSLKPIFADTERLLATAGIEGTRRGETFSLRELATLSRTLKALRQEARE
jgi:16S rRNA (adenine1518-N6/adenine1519-N6)-dimethyltransferase